MSVVPSLLQAIVKVDGEAMVVHAGEKPYVVAPAGQVPLASRELTLEAVEGIVSQLLPDQLRQTLEEFGAVQYELPASPEFPREHFTVIAARGGDDLWVELRRRRVPDEDLVPEEFFPPRTPEDTARPAAPPAAMPVADAIFEEDFAPSEPAPTPKPVAIPSTPATVLPLARNPIRATAMTPPSHEPPVAGLDRLFRVAAARGASTLYLSSGARPSVRVDGELQPIDGEPPLGARDVESLLLTLMPERTPEEQRAGVADEWISEIEGVGRIRCMTFRDQQGPGAVFRLMPNRSVSMEQLGLPQPVAALAIEPEGLIIVAGPRSSGKRTLMSAFVDQINRTRRDHVITIEREINIIHGPGKAFISQREVRGDDDEMAAAARGAVREDPDVLVIEDLRTGPLMNVALEAAAAGRLVIGGFSAHSAAGAIDRIIDLYAPEYRRQVQLALANSLRGVIVQVLLKKSGGGRVAAREVLLNTPAVATVIAEGRTSQLTTAIEGGRRYGMTPINDGLVALVQNGQVDAREAYRRATDRAGFLAALKRAGIEMEAGGAGRAGGAG